MNDRAYRQGRLVMDSKQDLVDEIERLRARAERAHDALNAMFWEGGVDQEDARKVQGILRGDDEQKAPDPPDHSIEEWNR